MWYPFNRFPDLSQVVILKDQLILDSIVTDRAVVVWREWRTSGGGINSIHHKRFKTQYDYSKTNLLLAIPNLIAYRAMDRMLLRKFIQTPYYERGQELQKKRRKLYNPSLPS